jgi:hypothetical protein
MERRFGEREGVPNLEGVTHFNVRVPKCGLMLATSRVCRFVEVQLLSIGRRLLSLLCSLC